MIPRGTSSRERWSEEGEGDRRGREQRGRPKNRDQGEKRETDTEERSLFGMSDSEAGRLCVFSGHAASTVPLKVLFNNVNVPH